MSSDDWPRPYGYSPLMPSELWQRLRAARRFADLTQQNLGDQCRVSRGAVALWEAAEPEHRTKPTIENLVKVAEATSVPLEWLMNDASKLDDVYKLATANLGPAMSNGKGRPRSQPVLPDLRNGAHLFVFASTPQQIADKLEQLADEPPETQVHMILVGKQPDIQVVDDVSAALALVVKTLQT